MVAAHRRQQSKIVITMPRFETLRRGKAVECDGNAAYAIMQLGFPRGNYTRLHCSCLLIVVLSGLWDLVSTVLNLRSVGTRIHS